MNVDDYDLSEFGVLEVGFFDLNGNPGGFTISNHLGATFARWLLDRPVLEADTLTGAVYVRGLYSRKLTLMRAKSLSRQQ